MPFTSEQYPGVVESRPEATRGFALNHSMMRIKDPERSLAFYTGVLGMRVLRRLDFEELNFSLYFLDCPTEGQSTPPSDVGERTVWTFSQRGLLELTHNWGSEDDPDLQFHDGNSEPQGFGHICVSVPDLDAAERWFDDNGVEFIKRPDQGKLTDVAFIRDPDGYWIEIVEPARLSDLGR
ncbi:lactoylglutathione lyase [Spiribacter aquaticus]|jgi:lactoylglutathione lyase|uniref:lactoylglutathione lyase n=1 Tax=Spiribacter aquaticus TaxID=1935996 RepID=A0A557RFC4_9GAMM|nr:MULTISPECIES: lactoylglutathione lyase [Spiribacter]AUB78450.1 lactoylglutathione lyase [Spiribacter roseus]KAF0280417.1 lactoylglutathione lyase [Spiribacter roseus]TVO63843.1 lactoylglutathione lyase [Spiribacter aquaticus]